ncbi:hypothetical protein OG21DRAFT_1227820 [Imleria badia]|nr:hypothetical protein OG21DRAFT_1227820 [Imleria badia]
MSGSSINGGLSIQDDIRNTRYTIMVAIAGFTVLVWDHIITFGDEVELIWKREKGLTSYLFLLVSYSTWFHCESRRETHHAHSCQRFVRYEGVMTVIGTQVAGLMMFLRVRAIYNGKKTVVWSMILLFFIWLGANAWLLVNGEAVQRPTMVHSCTMIFDASFDIASASAWLPLLFDTCIFALTVYKTKRRTGHLVRTLLSDGILYYSVICIVNVALTIMIVRAGQSVKNITAQLELLLTVAMVSRITLNLRKQALEDVFLMNSNDWTPHSLPRTTSARGESGSARRAGIRARANTAPSTAPRRNSITFRREIVSYPERVRLSTIYSINLRSEVTMTPPEEALRFKRPGVEEDVEAM